MDDVEDKIARTQAISKNRYLGLQVNFDNDVGYLGYFMISTPNPVRIIHQTYNLGSDLFEFFVIFLLILLRCFFFEFFFIYPLSWRGSAMGGLGALGQGL